MKLLRVLQQHELERVGGGQTIKVDVRVVAATNRDLAGEVVAGRFREDLYYRLNVVSVTMPPLRTRKSDIPLLCSHFIHKFSALHGKKISGLAPGTLNRLMTCDWPGNVRELSNVIERGVVLCRGEILSADDLATSKAVNAKGGFFPGATMQFIEREAILRTLQMVGGSTSEAATVLGISQRKVQYRINEYAALDAASV